eukprot:scaffold170592_cov13-Tisochrysis_lutea.AAC.1
MPEVFNHGGRTTMRANNPMPEEDIRLIMHEQAEHRVRKVVLHPMGSQITNVTLAKPSGIKSENVSRGQSGHA